MANECDVIRYHLLLLAQAGLVDLNLKQQKQVGLLSTRYRAKLDQSPDLCLQY